MGGRNQSIVTEFILQGYPSSQKVQLFLFVVLLHVYVMTIASNILIILSVKSDPKLHSPMYYFLSHFSFVDTCFISTTVPKMLFDLLKEHKSSSAAGCLAQFYFFMSFGVTEDFLLTVMALDRYMAICRPLHYNSLMNHILCRQLTLISYIVSFLVTLVPVIWISTLSFCCPNSIDHFICDFAPLLNLSCTDASLIELTFMIIECIIIFFCCVMILISYTFIMLTIARMPTTTGRKKAFSTCGSHLIVVTVFYGTLMFVYIRPTSKSSFSFDKVALIVFAVVVPFFNPIIYSLRNTEMKQAMHRAMKPFLRFWKK